MSINWFPGHMKKTKDLIMKNLKLVDICVEVVDARIPLASRNPLFDEILKEKSRIIAFNKSDLSDQVLNKKWEEYFVSKGMGVANINALKGTGIANLLEEIKNTYQNDVEEKHRKSVASNNESITRTSMRLNRPIRVMIVGVPNTGKSTLINQLVQKRVTQTGNRAGITKGKQWVRIREDISLFDTPGILWNKFSNSMLGYRLAICGSIRDEILNIEDIAVNFIKMIVPKYNAFLEKRYGIDVEETISEISTEFNFLVDDLSKSDEFTINNSQAVAIMEKIAIKRGCIVSKGEIDYFRVSNLVLDEFRKGIIGRITLEKPSS